MAKALLMSALGAVAVLSAAEDCTPRNPVVNNENILDAYPNADYFVIALLQAY